MTKPTNFASSAKNALFFVSTLVNATIFRAFHFVFSSVTISHSSPKQKWVINHLQMY